LSAARYVATAAGILIVMGISVKSVWNRREICGADRSGSG
jgi:hypothetical protein